MAKKYNIMANKLSIEQYEKAIISLTPGGSEFVNDPEYCAKHVKEFQASQHQIICNLVREKKRLQKNNSLLVEMLEKLSKNIVDYMPNVDLENTKQVDIYNQYHRAKELLKSVREV